MKIRFCIIIIFIGSILFAKDVKIFQTDLRYNYRIELLKLVLEKGDPDTVYNIVPYKFKVNFKRGINLLEEGKIDVASAFIDQDLNDKFYVIDYPILQGILGYRISFINKEKHSKWKQHLTIDDLRAKFLAGFVKSWGDYEILAHNNLSIVETNLYTNLFTMLEYKRFDFFPRGINEIWSEYDKFKPENPNLEIEKNHALYYPFPVNFFVNRENKELATIIENGIKIAEKDGSLKKLFWQHHKNDLMKSELNKRRIIYLENNKLINDSPQQYEHWWLKQLDEILSDTSHE
jgi:hypothetical protein